MTPDQIFSMQMELTDLRNKVAQYSKLGGNVGMGSKVDELVQILSEKVRKMSCFSAHGMLLIYLFNALIIFDKKFVRLSGI